jgi:hypothetical protein
MRRRCPLVPMDEIIVWAVSIDYIQVWYLEYWFRWNILQTGYNLVNPKWDPVYFDTTGYFLMI